jgi:hypothetical protein
MFPLETDKNKIMDFFYISIVRSFKFILKVGVGESENAPLVYKCKI